MSKEPCIPCEHLRKQQEEYKEFLYKKVKQRAINEQCNYAIWFDSEDKKYLSARYEDAKDRGINAIEIVSKYP
jgi:hypothetical protein